MVFPIIFVFFTFFAVVKSENSETSESSEEDSKKLNVFMDILLHQNKHIQNYEKFAKLLCIIEQKVAKNVLHAGKPKIGVIYEEYQQAISSNFNMADRTEEETMQFLLLLLSFATRLAFTMGSEALKKQQWGRTIQMNSFVLAHVKMEKVFSMEYYGQNFDYRYYRAGKMLLGDKHDKVTLDFLNDHLARELDEMRYERNFYIEIIHSHLQKKFHVDKIIFLLEQIESFSWKKGNFSTVEKHLFSITKLWIPEYSFGHVYMGVKVFAMKKFGANLANRVLRQPEAANYFQTHKEDEMKLRKLVEKLNLALEKYGKNNFNEDELDFLNKNGIYMHFEDAIQLEWN